ncbi:hypothetical protein HC175_20465, partial [Salinimicrobium sp. CDJ15-91]|nr:hypothetical protein [Salinimicrobium oceani]
SFGDYQTSVVKRSWTRSGNTRLDLISGQPHDPAYSNLIALITQTVINPTILP